MDEEVPEKEGIHRWLDIGEFPDNLKKYFFFCLRKDNKAKVR